MKRLIWLAITAFLVLICWPYPTCPTCGEHVWCGELYSHVTRHMNDSIRRHTTRNQSTMSTVDRTLTDVLISTLNKTAAALEAFESIVSAPLKLSADERPYPNQWRLETIRTPNEVGVSNLQTRSNFPLTLKWTVSSRGIMVMLCDCYGTPFRIVQWPFTDDPRGENELP